MVVVRAIVDSQFEVEYFPLGAPYLYGDDLGNDNGLSPSRCMSLHSLLIDLI